MSSKRAFGAVLAAFCLFAAAPAHAEEWTKKSFLMPQGSFEITGDPARPAMMGVNLSRDRVAKPINLAPHFYWAATDDLSLGISHGTGLCFNDCRRVYDDVGFDMMYYLTGSDRFEIDLHAGAPINTFDPFMIGTRAGILGRVNLGSVTALVFDPSFYFGITNRRKGNRESLSLPIWFYFQATDVVVPFVGSGLHGPLDDFTDHFRMPLEGGMLFDVAKDVDVGFMFSFPHLVGPGSNVRERYTSFLGRFRF